MFEKLISTLMASRDQAHVFHWQVVDNVKELIYSTIYKLENLN
jgi:hypothetical protein